MKLINKLSRAIFVVVLLVIVLLIGFYSMFGQGGYSPSYSERKITYNIGGEVFSIPRNYIIHGPSLNKNSKHIIMEALYPSFEAQTQDNEHEFKKLGWHNKVMFSLIEAAKTNRAEYAAEITINKNEEYSFSNYVFVKKINGLSLYKQPGSYDKYIFDSATIGEKWRVFACTEEDNLPQVQHHPYCQIRFNLTDNIQIDYSFSKDYLFQWQDIETSIISLITDFKQTSPSN